MIWGIADGATGLCDRPARGRTSHSAWRRHLHQSGPQHGIEGPYHGDPTDPVGVGIPIHRHFEMDEAFCVIAGRGILILNDVPHFIETGGTIFIPKNTWHGFENADSELVLLWIVAPPGLEAFFRKVAAPPGEPAIQRTKDQLNEIARRYGTEFR